MKRVRVRMKYVYVVDFNLVMMIIQKKNQHIGCGEQNGLRMGVSGFLKRLNLQNIGVQTSSLMRIKVN